MSVVSTVIAMVVGSTIGLAIAGSHRAVRGPLTRLVDAGLALPGILIALVLAAKLGPGNTTATLAIIIWQVPVAARVTIGPARQVLALDYVEAAYGYGRRKPYVLMRHVLPNISPLLIVLGSVMFAAAILDRGGAGVPRRRRPTTDLLMGTVPQRDAVAARSGSVPHVLPRAGDRPHSARVQPAR